MRISILGLLLLASCMAQEPVLLYHRTGSSFAERFNDGDACLIKAIKDVPSDVRYSSTPGYSNPGSLSCRTSLGVTSCQTIGAYSVTPTLQSHDVNAGLRQRQMDRCMAAKGYSILTRPVCADEASKKRYLAMKDIQPPADRITCVVK